MKSLLFATVGALLFAGNAQAASFVTNREALGANDSVNWAVLGPTFTTVSNPLATTSLGGIGLEASLPVGSFSRLDQTPFFPGSFTVGDALLTTGLSNPGPLTITFDTPIVGAGTQIESDPIKDVNYTATIEAFDSLDRSLGTFAFPGVSSNVAGSGVIFIGLSDSQADIKKLVFNTKEQGVDVPFAINTISLKTEEVPEPDSLLGFCAVGAVLVAKHALSTKCRC